MRRTDCNRSVAHKTRTSAKSNMHVVEITGWERGFNKVACISTLCSVAKLNLSEAKRITDAVLDGSAQRIQLSSEEDVGRLVEFLQLHGAVVCVV